MARVNNLTIVGNLTRDPELRFTPAGNPVASFGIAVNRSWQNSSGEWVEETNFFEVTAWNNLAENCAESLSKGDRVIVSGRLNWRSWENSDGTKRSKVDIVADAIGPSLEFATAKITKNVKGEALGGKIGPVGENVDLADEDIPF